MKREQNDQMIPKSITKSLSGQIGLRKNTLLLLASFLWVVQISGAFAHIVPPEQFHPVAESYRRMTFMLNLNPVLWDEVNKDVELIMESLALVDEEEAKEYMDKVNALIRSMTGVEGSQVEAPSYHARKQAAREIFELCTSTVAEILISRLEESDHHLGEYPGCQDALDTARQIWASFEHEVKFTDRSAFLEIGRSWLELNSAIGSAGISGIGVVSADSEKYHQVVKRIIQYVSENFGEDFRAQGKRKLAPLPWKSKTGNITSFVPIKLPPGSEMNKQLPRPRQILNMAERGVDESETPLIALGDMAFDSPHIFGEPALSLQISCNTCHNKGVTNPQFLIPGLSSYRGGMDVSNSFFASHANNGHFGGIDIPDLRGIRFTAPYGRNGRFASLREFTRNVIVHEFNGPEPDPILLDGLVAYMNEFDFLPNPKLNTDGTLSEIAGESAERGEILFNRKFQAMGDRSCATCHIPSANFLDHKRHDVGTAHGTAPGSQDRAMDTPTLLSSKFTAPYFHDGSQPTLRSVNEWFNEQYQLKLSKDEIDDLTAYLEAIGDGVDAYEDTYYTLEAEMEEFKFFLSAIDYLKRIKKPELIGLTLQTVAQEIHAHKWDVQDDGKLPTLNQMAALIEEANELNEKGLSDEVDRKLKEYHKLYEENTDDLR